MKKESKLIDVAEAANVSLTTASLVLNGRGNISNIIRQKVLEAASELSYKPRRKPKAPIRPETYALIVDMSPTWGFAWSFYEPILEGLKAGFKPTDYNPIIIPHDVNVSAKKLLDQLRLMDCRMVFSLECENADVIEYLERNSIEVIVINDSQFQNRFHTICQDDVQGGYDATTHLIDHGHRNIWITDWHRPYNPGVSTDRFIGYKKAFDEHRIRFEDEYHVTLQSASPEELQKLTQMILDAATKPTALYVHGDYLAHKLLLHLLKARIRIPEDISIIAHGDLLIYQPNDPLRR